MQISGILYALLCASICVFVRIHSLTGKIPLKCEQLQSDVSVSANRNLYLLQSENVEEIKFFEHSCTSNIIHLVWSDPPPPGHSSIFFPNSSVLQRRNRLYQEAQHRFPNLGADDSNLSYLIFVDDIRRPLLITRPANHYEETACDTGWFIFERLLRKFQPAMAAPAPCRSVGNSQTSSASYHSGNSAQQDTEDSVEVAFDLDSAGILAVNAEVSTEISTHQLEFFLFHFCCRSFDIRASFRASFICVQTCSCKLRSVKCK